jgi:hypothetical protein
MVRKTFNSRTELLDLLRKIPWAEGKTGPTVYGHWNFVVFDDGNQTRWIPTPTKVTIYLDRHLEENLHGFMVLHGALDNYLGICKEGLYQT